MSIFSYGKKFGLCGFVNSFILYLTDFPKFHPRREVYRFVLICSFRRYREPVCLSPDNVTGMTWHVACGNSSAHKGGGREIHRKNFSMAIGVVLILCVSAILAIFVAIHENMKSRQVILMQRQSVQDLGDGGHHHNDGGHSEWTDGDGGHGRAEDDNYADECEAAAASVAKLSQLPTYEEAVMLSKKPSPRRIKRLSYTQMADTGETGIVDDIAATAADRLLGDDEMADDADRDAGRDRLLSRSPTMPTRHRVTEL